MNKGTLIFSIALLSGLALTPMTSAQTNQPSITPTKSAQPEREKLDEPLQVGDKMISFEIPSAESGTISLDEMLKDGPVVLTFYRGSWCPYCRGELSSIQTRLDKITQAGASVLAISPEIPQKTADLKEQKKLGFNFGTDHNNALAKRLALAFKLDAKTIKKYRDYGIDLPESNDSKSWELPIPATYVIDTDHTIRYAFVDEDYTKRADYDDVLKVLEKIKEED